MGGSCSGPAGTGKTETTKDLGRSFGFMVYVFNCSAQMDYKSCGNIYKGLAQSGTWGCFDEFNRISVEVLSVISVQLKTIQDAIKTKKYNFTFLSQDISLKPTVGIFITMNPEYKGRTEMPENLRILFRPCAMVVPDIELISEIMLVAEGFMEARSLARKFITLYTLCKDLLSKQDHYDWGLRGIKSLLVVAGALRRSERGRPEDQVLFRALRDFNTPKVVTDDLPIFMGLLSDLFPLLDVPRKVDLEFESLVRVAAVDLKLKPEENYVLKCVQLKEILDVRHSVLIVGNAGTGKTQIWRGLSRTFYNQKKKPYIVDLNPKALTSAELFGAINTSTREWKDGLFAVIFRDVSNMTSDGPKWIVLDGEVDPGWTESLNSVMDDNKVLTLASNERIPLTLTMRLIFEVGHLKSTNPATVSRAGILYINQEDLGWRPIISSWLDTRESQVNII
jgi:dynein heavy chain, axonemal